MAAFIAIFALIVAWMALVQSRHAHDAAKEDSRELNRLRRRIQALEPTPPEQALMSEEREVVSDDAYRMPGGPADQSMRSSSAG